MNRLTSRLRRPVPVALLAAATYACVGAAGAAASPYPLHLTTAAGAVTLTRAPVRIVSLSPSATQDLFAVGAGSQVVAVDSYSTYPARAPRTSLSAFTPNAEAIAKYRPDLVLVADDINHVVAQLRALGIPVLLEPAASDLGGVYAEIEQIAQATGHGKGGASVVLNLRRQVSEILRSLKRPLRPLTVYNELDQKYYSATSRTFIGQMDKLLGLVNIADKTGGSSQYPQLSAEYIVASDPDLIVLADTVCCGQDRATVAARPGWNTIAAVRSGAIVPVNDAIASQWGPRIVLFLKAVARAVVKLEETRK
jgi:iron complex transport system substrate-binding protein